MILGMIYACHTQNKIQYSEFKWFCGTVFMQKGNRQDSLFVDLGRILYNIKYIYVKKVQKNLKKDKRLE